MIRIYNNKDIKVVTKGAFESIFKPLGYKQVIEVKENKTKTNEDKVVPKFNKPKAKDKEKETELE